MTVEIGFSEGISLVALGISIIGTLIIPWCKNRREKKQLQKEVNSYKSMLKNEYVKEFSDIVDTFLKGDSYLLYTPTQSNFELAADRQSEIKNARTVFINISGIKTNRLNYMLKNELSYLTSKNQFKIIRMTEFTKMYFANTDKIIKTYSNKLDQTKTEKLRLKELKKLTGLYFSKIDDYANFKTDYLLSDKEVSDIQEKIQKA